MVCSVTGMIHPKVSIDCTLVEQLRGFTWLVHHCLPRSGMGCLTVLEGNTNRKRKLLVS